MRNFLLLIIIGILLSGCATAQLTPSAWKIKEADAEMVKDCTPTGNITMASRWGSVLSFAKNHRKSKAMLDVKNKILNRAAYYHATHVVWGETQITEDKYVKLTGSAYICDTNCYFKAEEMTSGRDIEDVKKSFNCSVKAESEFLAPHDAKEKIVFLQYSLVPSDCDCSINEDFYMLFSHGNLLYWGKGEDVKNVEMEFYKNYAEDLLKKGSINHVGAEKLIYEKYKQLYVSNIMVDEFFKYKIMIADKLDKKEISLVEADYLITKKQADIYREEQINERDRRRDERERKTAEFQEEQSKKLLNMMRQSIMIRMLSELPRAVNPSINCTASRIGDYTYTHCN